MIRDTVALVLAAGRGLRAGEGVPKQFRPLCGVPVVRRAVLAFRAHPEVDRVMVVGHADDRLLLDEAVRGLDLPAPVVGGAERRDSVRHGLRAVAEAGRARRVLIHDAARPLVSAGIISRVVRALDRHDGAVPVVPVADSLVRATAGGVADVPRADLFRVQTPQGFGFEAIRAAHAGFTGAATDDASVARAAGLDVALVPGEERNIKITTGADFVLAERLLGGEREVRTGTGLDVHRFGGGDHVMLCGVKVAHEAGLVGHSDADVGLHALTDALLGAAALGDIGEHFSPADPRWRGADSALFLRHALDLVRGLGGRVLNVDLTIICERPKVGPHRAAMQARVAELLELAPSRVSIKATTTEGLGFAGRREGIAAQASATISLPAAEPCGGADISGTDGSAGP